MGTSLLTVTLPDTVQPEYGRSRRWVDPGFDRDGDPCMVLNFDFGACKIQQYLYFDNAPREKYESTQQFLLSCGFADVDNDFDGAFEHLEALVQQLHAVQLEADHLLGGLRVSAYKLQGHS